MAGVQGVLGYGSGSVSRFSLSTQRHDYFLRLFGAGFAVELEQPQIVAVGSFLFGGEDVSAVGLAIRRGLRSVRLGLSWLWFWFCDS